MASQPKSLSAMRRRAVDRLLIDYLELPEREQPAWLEQIRQRRPRLGRWLAQLIDHNHTVTLLNESVRRVAGESMARVEISAARLENGDRLGPWKVLEEVGQGGMGRVYRGRRADGAFEMEVAIKQIGQRRRGLAELLQRECRLLAKLDHPSVTRLVDAGLDDRAGPFLVMEWIEGTDLADWLKQESPDLETRLKLFEQIAEAVAHAHQRLIVHGDIKPNNIRIRNDGSVKLMDFGIARLQDSGGDDALQLRALTPSFAAPEQLSGELISVRSDVYSLGMLLYWLLTGETPSHGQAGIGERLRYLSGRRRREVIAIFERACPVDPEERYASVAAMIADIRHLLSGRPIAAVPATRRYRLRCLISRNPFASGLGALLALSLLAGAGALVLQTEQTRQAAEQAIREADRTRAVRDFLVEMLSEADPFLVPGEPPTIRDVLRRSGAQVSERFADQPDIAFELLSVIGTAHQGLGDPTSARPHLRSALDMIREDPTIARESLDLARATYMLALVVGYSDERARLVVQTLAELKNHDEQDPLLESGALSLLAHDAFSRQDYETAVQHSLDAETLACSAQAIDEDAHHCVATLSDQFFYLSGAGQSERALDAARRSYELANEHFGHQAHPILVSSGVSYANALIDHHRPSEAITLSEELLEILATYSDEQSPVPAYIDFPLARAHSAQGSDHLAVEKWVRALDLLLEREPDGLGIPVQLNFLVSRLLELGDVEAARLAYETYFPVTWDNTPDHALWFRRLNELRMLELTEGVPDQRWWQELEEFQEHSAHQVPHIMGFALAAALDGQNPDSARAWIQAAKDADAQAGGPGVWETLRARYHLLRDELSPARSWLDKAAEAFEQRGETTGPRRSALLALEGELLCRRDQTEQGIERLQSALEYWQESIEPPAGHERVSRLAPSCPASG